MTKSNKEIALEVLTRAFTDRDPTVVEQLFSVNYKQHNPAIPDGPAAIAKMIPTLTNLRYEPGMAIAAGNLVMVHGRYTGWGPKPMVAVDIFRVEGGKVLEHWDVLQEEVPIASTASGNPMFTKPREGESAAISKEAVMTARNVVDENKRLVTEFYELAVNQQKPAEAARKYIGLPYRQHNPEVVDGPDGFVQFIGGMQKKHPTLRVVISKVLGDDDLVALHVHLTREANDPGLAIAELFRVKNGKIIEHWDVVQPVPAKTVSGNSMF